MFEVVSDWWNEYSSTYNYTGQLYSDGTDDFANGNIWGGIAKYAAGTLTGLGNFITGGGASYMGEALQKEVGPGTITSKDDAGLIADVEHGDTGNFITNMAGDIACSFAESYISQENLMDMSAKFEAQANRAATEEEKQELLAKANDLKTSANWYGVADTARIAGSIASGCSLWSGVKFAGGAIGSFISSKLGKKAATDVATGAATHAALNAAAGAAANTVDDVVVNVATNSIDDVVVNMVDDVAVGSASNIAAGVAANTVDDVVVNVVANTADDVIANTVDDVATGAATVIAKNSAVKAATGLADDAAVAAANVTFKQMLSGVRTGLTKAGVSAAVGLSTSQASGSEIWELNHNVEQNGVVIGVIQEATSQGAKIAKDASYLGRDIVEDFLAKFPGLGKFVNTCRAAIYATGESIEDSKIGSYAMAVGSKVSAKIESWARQSDYKYKDVKLADLADQIRTDAQKDDKHDKWLDAYRAKVCELDEEIGVDSRTRTILVYPNKKDCSDEPSIC
ncbi:hypothetical protein J6A31_04815 [bacterium]|nr:hypothetical protein [bacterium]